jgi:hypothetical protein
MTDEAPSKEPQEPEVIDVPAIMKHHNAIFLSKGIKMFADDSRRDKGFMMMWLEKTNRAGEHCVFESWYRKQGNRPWRAYGLRLFVNDEEIDIMGKLEEALKIMGRTDPSDPLPVKASGAKSDQTLRTKKNTVIRV